MASSCFAFGYFPKAVEVKEGWRELRNEELNDI